MTLLVSLKDKLSKVLNTPELSNAFRQVEIWGNQNDAAVSTLKTTVASLPVIAATTTSLNGSTPVLPLQIQTGYSSGTTSASGALSVAFPKPFPNGLVAAVPIDVVGSAQDSQCLVSSTSTKTTLTTFFISGGAAYVGAVNFCWIAIGW